MSVENRPKVGVGVYIIKGGKVLLGERIGSHQANTFCAPGGHLEYGESWEECAKREVVEETGLVVNNIKFLGLTNDILSNENKHYITIAMLADWENGEPQNLEQDKCLGWNWYGLDEIPDEKAVFLANFLNSEFVDNLKNILKNGIK